MSDDLAVPCPWCGHHTLYRPEDYTEGGPVMCANPWCPSNLPPCPDGCPAGCPACLPEVAAKGP